MKNYGNKIFNLKTRFRALCSEWWMQCFFQKSTPGFQKRTFINVHFSKRDLKSWNFHTSSLFRRPPSLFRGVTFMLCFTFYFIIDLEHYGVDRMFAYFSQKMVQNMANLFFIKQGWSFSGDVWNIRRNQNSIYVPKMGVLVLTPFLIFIPTFWGIFRISMEILYSNLLSTFNYIIYKTYLKKPWI